MTNQSDAAPLGARFAIYAAAFAWPWGVYETLPAVWQPASAVLGLFVLGVSGIDVLRRRRLDIPFDLVWPALVCLAAGIAALAAKHGHGLPIAAASLVYLATVYAIRSRDAIAHALWLSLISGACVASLTLASRGGLLLPTVFAADAQGLQETHARLATRLFASPPSLAFASSLPSGLFTLLVCGALAAYTAASRGLSRASRTLAAVAALLVASALLANLLPAYGRFVEWRPFHGLRESGFGIAAGGCGLWLAAQVVLRNARVLKRARVSLLHPGAGGVAVGALSWLVLPFAIAPHHGFLLGVAAAYGLRENPEAAAPPPRLWMALPLVFLGLFNVWTVSLDNRADPRNYEAVVLADLEDGYRGAAFDRVAALRALGIQERRLYLAQARIALAYERPHWAAHSAAQAVRFAEPGRTVLPAPASGDLQRFLTALREFTSHRNGSEASIAQESALAQTGQTEAALSLLESKARGTRNLALLEMPSGVAADALTFLLAAPEIGSELRGWPHEALCATLDRVDARVEPVPEGFPAELLPLVVAYRPSANGYSVRVWTKAQQVAAEVPMLWLAPQSPPPDATTVAWKQAAPIGSEWWRFTLSLRPQARAIAVMIEQDGAVTIDANPLPIEDLPDDVVVLVMR